MEVQNELKPPEPGKTKGTGKSKEQVLLTQLQLIINYLFDSSVIIPNFWCKTNFCHICVKVLAEAHEDYNKRCKGKILLNLVVIG